jgi:hypothetical protein
MKNPRKGNTIFKERSSKRGELRKMHRKLIFLQGIRQNDRELNERGGEPV